MSFHINSVTDKIDVCNATVRACPLGSIEEHYDSKEAAQGALESRYAEQLGAFGGLTKKSKEPALIDRKKEADYTDSQREAIWGYREGLSWSVNRRLRGGGLPSPVELALIRSFDKILALSRPLKEGVVLKRSLATLGGSQYALPSEGIYSDLAYLSCSESDSYIEDTLRDGVDLYSESPADTVLTIEVPAGARILALSLENPDYAMEAEVVLPRGSKMEILEDSGYVKGVRRVRARLIVE